MVSHLQGIGLLKRPVAATVLPTKKLVVLAGLIACFALTGCQTPDLKPFATATGTLTTGINRGGDLAIAPVARELFYKNDGELIAPDSPDHPAVKLALEWQARRKAADALLSYSASLAAIGDASAHRKANATALYDSVKQLAAAIPGVGLGTSAGGNLIVTALGQLVEIKAWRDMASAVKGADPAIQVIAATFKKDLEDMALLHEAQFKSQLIAAGGTDTRKLIRLETQLRGQQESRRAAVAADLGNATAATELVRVDSLLEGVARDLQPRRDAIASTQAALAEGKNFYATAIAAVDAWAAAHADLVKVFEEKRVPNLALLLARAEELNSQIEEFKNAQKSPTAP